MLVVPRFVAAVRLAGPGDLPAAADGWSGRAASAPYWWPIGPIVLVVLAVAWVRSGTTAGLRGGAWSGLRLFPWMGSLLSDYEAANFSELLALLLEHRVPYPSAMVLAAEATGNPRIRGAAAPPRRSAAASRRRRWQTSDRGAFPPMLRWALATGQAQGSLSRPCGTWPASIASGPSTGPSSSRCSCPRSSWSCIGASATAVLRTGAFPPVINLLRQLSDN